MTASADADVRHTATAYRMIDSREKRQWPLQRKEFSHGLLLILSSTISYIATARMGPQGSYTGITEYHIIRSQPLASYFEHNIVLCRRHSHILIDYSTAMWVHSEPLELPAAN